MNWIAADPMWWVAFFSVFTSFSLNQLGLVSTALILAPLGIGYAIFAWRKASKSGSPLNTIYPPPVMMGSPPVLLQNALEARIDADIKAINDSITSLKVQVEQSYNVHSRGYLHLVAVLKAREARKMIRESDTTVQQLAGRLSADAASLTYSNDHEWMAEFNRWEQELKTIDRIVGEWMPSNRAFLNIERTELERVVSAPPEKIRSERTATRYKTFLIAQERYAADREKLLVYFDTKANELP